MRIFVIVLMLRFFLTRPMAHLSVSLAADDMGRQTISVLLVVVFLSFRGTWCTGRGRSHLVLDVLIRLSKPHILLGNILL
jgi:hypothetical protein